jgi:peptidylprolyl isomerase
VESRTLRPLGVAAIAALLALTSACTGSTKATPSPSASASATASADPSASASSTITPAPVVNTLDAIQVSGTFNADATVTVPSPMSIDETRSKVISQGSGQTVSATAIVKVQYVGVNGRTTQVFDSSFTSGKSVELSLDGGVVPGFTKGLTGQKVGSRVLIAMPGADGYDGSDKTSAGIYQGDTLVFVVDIVDSSYSGPSGTSVPVPANLPQVSDDNGKPKVIIPAGVTPPTTTTAQVVIQGTGAKVSAGDYLVTHYVGYSWTTGQVIDDHSTKVDIDKLVNAIQGMQTGLVNQNVGSRILLVIPTADSWPEGNTNPVVVKGDTVVYVVDVLYATSGS